MNWLPIESAPIEPFSVERWYMNATPLLFLWFGSYAGVGSFGYTRTGKGRWLNSLGHVCHPTHWLLPEPPK